MSVRLWEFMGMCWKVLHMPTVSWSYGTAFNQEIMQKVLMGEMFTEQEQTELKAVGT